jgi:protein TonB
MRDIAFALSGFAHMVLVMMVLQPSRAVPPALDGETVKDSVTITLTASTRWRPPTAPARLLAQSEPPSVHQQELKTEPRIPHPLPRISQHHALKPAEAAPASPPAETVAALPAATQLATAPPEPAAPVEILHPKFREPPEPAAYPPKALTLNQQGEVLVRARIDRDGNPESVELARGSGFPMLDEAALLAVRRWRFVPAQVGGVPVPATVQVPVLCHLQ